MILLLGGSGYVGQSFQRFFNRQAIGYRSVSRTECDYSQLDSLIALIRETRAEFLINAAGYTGKPNVDACEIHRSDCLLGNAVLPGIIQLACEHTGMAWGHVSSGCIYTGRHADGRGFSESDPPNFSFRSRPCSYYSGCKALGEEILAGAERTFIWRLRIPFNHLDGPRNYLSKLMRYQRLLNAENSISQLDEFVEACWKIWSQRVPFGTYNITQPGAITTPEVVEMIRQELGWTQDVSYFRDEQEFMAVAATTPRSNCVLDSGKLASVGIHLSPVQDAIRRSLRRWTPESASRPPVAPPLAPNLRPESSNPLPASHGASTPTIH